MRYERKKYLREQNSCVRLGSATADTTSSATTAAAMCASQLLGTIVDLWTVITRLAPLNSGHVTTGAIR